MTLYEIEQEILNCVDEETGEVDAERLATLEMERDAKISNIACWIKELKAESKAIKEEEEKLSVRRKAVDNRVTRLTDFIASFLNGMKYKDARVSITYRHSTSTEFNGDIDKLPEDCVKVEKKASLTAIKERLLAGEKIDGAVLVEKESIQIR